MTQDDIKKLMETMFQEELKEHQSKSADYSSPEDGLSNFRTIGKELNIDAFKVWYIFFKKHVAAIAHYCSEGSLKSEPIQGRIKDCRFYLVLLRALIEDKKDWEEGELAEKAALCPGLGLCAHNTPSKMIDEFRKEMNNVKIND